VNGYVPYPYGYAPTLQQPKRDGYLFGISITSLIASILAILGGLGAALFFALYSAVPFLPGGSAIDDKSLFNGMMMFAAFSIAGLAGGGFGMYHSIRSLIRKPSVNFRLPAYWIFFICYLAILVIGFLFAFSNQQLEGSFGLGLLVALGGIFPALGFWSLAAQLLSNARAKLWPTTWRRAVLSLISGATLSIALAMVLEMIFSLPFAALGGLSGDALPSSFQDLAGLLVVIAVIAPLVEEMVKPLAPVILIGRINSAAESFLLGMSAGIGFNLVETIGYISSDYSNWLTIALERSTAGLLHGVGAGMVALGWYYWTHRNSVKNRGWVGTACVLIAVLQHAIWNGSVILAYIPGPIGTFLREGVLVITNDIRIDAFVLVYVLLSVLILAMLLYVTQSIRLRPVYNMGSFQSVPSQAQQERAQAPVPVVPRPVAQQMPPVASQQAQQERAQAPVPVAPVVPQQERAQIPVPPIAPQQAIQGEQAPAVAEPPSSSEQLEPVASSELPATEQAERPVEESTPISEVTERPVQASPASSEQSTEETQTKE
jgi:RsiW-degrading membrane proteinase PrsW (M82 family)